MTTDFITFADSILFMDGSVYDRRLIFTTVACNWNRNSTTQYQEEGYKRIIFTAIGDKIS